MGGTSTAAQLPADGGASSSRNKLVLAGYLACLLAGGVLGCLFGTVLENLLRHALPLPYNLQLHHVIFAIAFLAANVIFESESTAPLLLSGSNVVFGFLLARTASRIFLSSKLNEEWFLLSFLLFHLFEFYFVATFHAPELRFGSFVLDPVPYHLYFFVFLSAGVEFAARTAIFAPPSTSCSWWSSWTQLAGFFLTFGGLSFRVVALWTAGGSFTHVVQTEKRPAHRLVRTGTYGLCRHPGYVGWLCWSVGTQLLLGNPVNLVLFSGIGYAFLYQRIRVEEHFLVGFFGTDYLEYAKKVPAGVPFASQIERYERYHGAGAGASPAEGRAERTMNKAD